MIHDKITTVVILLGDHTESREICRIDGSIQR